MSDRYNLYLIHHLSLARWHANISTKYKVQMRLMGMLYIITGTIKQSTEQRPKFDLMMPLDDIKVLTIHPPRTMNSLQNHPVVVRIFQS